MSRNTVEDNPLVLPDKSNGESIRRRASAYHDPLPGALIGWLTRQAKPGSVRVHLVASTDGSLGQIIISSYDENDNNLGDETLEVTTLDYLLAV